MTVQQTQAPLLLYQNSPTFIRLLIRDRCFVLLSPLRLCALHCVGSEVTLPQQIKGYGRLSEASY